VTIYTIPELRCDHPNCDYVVTGSPGGDATQLRREAHNLGWHHHGGKDSCPQHVMSQQLAAHWLAEHHRLRGDAS
jgi:hypothetical protein